MKTMKTVVISRKKWTRGGRGEPALRTESGQSCCLGFVARAFGLRTPATVQTFSSLADGGADISKLPKPLRPTRRVSGIYRDSGLHDKLTRENDCSLSKSVGALREAKITKLLAKAGVRAVFVD